MDGTERSAREGADTLEQMLRLWARDDAAADARAPAVAAAAVAAITADRGRHGLRRRGPLAGGALLAAAAAGIMLLGWPGGTGGPPRAVVDGHAGSGVNTDAALASFALLYTPSWEEEQYL